MDNKTFVLNLWRHDHTHDVFDVLNDREKQIMTMRFGLEGKPPESLAAIASKFRVTRERIRQITERALVKLREKAEIK